MAKFYIASNVLHYETHGKKKHTSAVYRYSIGPDGNLKEYMGSGGNVKAETIIAWCFLILSIGYMIYGKLNFDIHSLEGKYSLTIPAMICFIAFMNLAGNYSIKREMEKYWARNKNILWHKKTDVKQ